MTPRKKTAAIENNIKAVLPLPPRPADFEDEGSMLRQDPAGLSDATRSLNPASYCVTSDAITLFDMRRHLERVIRRR